MFAKTLETIGGVRTRYMLTAVAETSTIEVLTHAHNKRYFWITIRFLFLGHILVHRAYSGRHNFRRYVNGVST